MTLAGPEAQEYYTGKKSPGAWADDDWVDKFIREIFQPEDEDNMELEGRAYKDTLRDKVQREIIMPYWRVIETVANELLQKRKLTSTEIEEIIARTTQGAG